ncbi:alpha-L-fucosidase [Pedobacter sp. Leaf250]|uniref:alpha-L-fucosidase n=1 Tax=Pedobacter sp. Leaf250 TaxID=2876559 RepID=UPI001E4AEAB2|nr:alpha-L-fucosidase [Pedobacter sp. Leaf250]
MRILKCIFAILLFININLLAQERTDHDRKMEWFSNAKLGIFIHWGIYSVNGISESWSFFNNYINHDAYMKQLNSFNAQKYNPQEWVNLIQESGAKYAVITSKHHDGVALWDSKMPQAITTVNHSAAKKDLITPFVKHLKQAGLKTGLYFSLPDWSNPDYDVFTRERKRYDINKEPKKWDAFLNYYHNQLKELSTQYNPDLLWFDGDWEHNAQEWQTDKVRSLLKAKNQNIIINSRLDKHGDYETPEQGIPVFKPNNKYWELCYTMNDSWGYQPYDNHYKSSNMIIRTLVDCISMGGNLLLDIGPKPDGTIAPEQVKILKDLGRWTKKHAEGIYETQAGIPDGHFEGKTALSKNKDILYLYVDYKTKNGIVLTGIKSKINKVEILGNGASVNIKKLNETDYILHVNESDFDKDVTVIKVSLNQAIQLSEEKQQAISVETLFTKTQQADMSNYNLSKLSSDLNSGTNIFKNISLVADGLGFKSGVKNFNPTVNDWVIKNAEALYQTKAGIPTGHYSGNTVLSADNQTLYLFVEGQHTGPIAIKGLVNNISRIRIVGDGTMLSHEIYNKLYWSKIPGAVYIDIPKDKLDKQLTVVALLLDGPVKLYREKVGAIESNL